MKHALAIALVLVSIKCLAEGEKVKPIDWEFVKTNKISITSSSNELKNNLEKKLNVDNSSLININIDSYYIVYSDDENGLPGEVLSFDEAMSGKKPDRMNMKPMACNIQKNTGKNELAMSIGKDVGVDIGGMLNSSGFSNMSNIDIAGVGLVVGVVAALITKSGGKIDCDKTHIVCPISDKWCYWREKVITTVTLKNKNETIGKDIYITESYQRGIHALDLATKHLSELPFV